MKKKFNLFALSALLVSGSAGIPVFAQSTGTVAVQLEQSTNPNNSVQGVEMALVKVADKTNAGYAAQPFFSSMNLTFNPSATAVEQEEMAVALYGKLIDGIYTNNLLTATPMSMERRVELFDVKQDTMDGQDQAASDEQNDSQSEADSSAQQGDSSADQGDSADQGGDSSDAADEPEFGDSSTTESKDEIKEPEFGDSSTESNTAQDTEQDNTTTPESSVDEQLSNAAQIWSQVLDIDQLTYSFDISNQAGQLSFTGLDFGAWLLFETDKAKYDYIEPALVYVPDAAGQTSVAIQPKHRQDLILELVKKDAATGLTIVDSATTFTNQLGQTFNTNMGVAEIPLSHGGNVIRESVAPKGYVLSAKNLQVQVNGLWVSIDNKGYNPFASFTFYNTKEGDNSNNNNNSNQTPTQNQNYNSPTTNQSTGTQNSGTDKSPYYSSVSDQHTGNFQNNWIYWAVGGAALIGLGGVGYYIYKKRRGSSNEQS